MRYFILVVAATAENYDNSKDDYPGAVVVKKMAQAVVIHKICSSEMCSRFFLRSLTYYAEEDFVIQRRKAPLNKGSLYISNSIR